MPGTMEERTAACRAATRERASRLPDSVWDCEACGAEDSIQIRSSHLNRDVYADDITFKCDTCRMTRTHGVPFETMADYEAERERRHGTVVDFAEDPTPDRDVTDHLEALGYLAAAQDAATGD